MVGMEVSSTDAGAVGTVTCGMSHARMCGCVKADNNDMGANVGMHESHGVGDRCRRRVVGMQEHMGCRFPMDFHQFPAPYNYLKSGTPGQKNVCSPSEIHVFFNFSLPLGNLHNSDTMP